MSWITPISVWYAGTTTCLSQRRERRDEGARRLLHPGEYDRVVISEAADENMAMAFALAQAVQGNVRSTTMRAFDPAEFEAIVKLML